MKTIKNKDRKKNTKRPKLNKFQPCVRGLGGTTNVHYPKYMNTCFGTKALLEVITKIKTDTERNILREKARYSYPLCDVMTRKLIKRSSIGSQSSPLTVEEKIDRMLRCRPLSFYTSSDHTKYKDNKPSLSTYTTDDYIKNSEKHPHELMNYDEIAVSALLGVSCYTPIYNSGERSNGGVIEYQENPPWIVLIGLVGPRFEKTRDNLMEAAHMMVSKSHIKENGYGIDKIPNPKLKFWEELYDVDHFPSYKEAQNDKSGLYLTNYNDYLNIDVYKKRLRLVFCPFIQDAICRGQQFNKKIHLFVTGLGLGHWGIEDPSSKQDQRNIYVNTFVECLLTELLSSSKIHAEGGGGRGRTKLLSSSKINICNVTFSWIKINSELKKTIIDKLLNEHEIVCEFTENKKEKEMGSIANNCRDKLIVAMYAWDGNAYPGNEFYDKAWDASGDPAAACCTAISILQSPEGNPSFINGKACKFYKRKDEHVAAWERAYKLLRDEAAERGRNNKIRKALKILVGAGLLTAGAAAALCTKEGRDMINKIYPKQPTRGTVVQGATPANL